MVDLRRQGTGSARDIVYAALREQILSLALKPGTSLSENETSLKFQVSRTPVRESFMKLAQEGLMQVLPQRGTFVSLIDTALVEEARFMREHLECAVAELACGSFREDALLRLETNLTMQQAALAGQDDGEMFELDEQFHRILFEGCGKSHTWNTLNGLTVHLNRSRRLMLANAHDWRHLYEQHRRMADAIIAKDAAGARLLMKQHLTLNIADQAELRIQYPNYFKD
ncbi:GntR family transcriptional regulator [Paenibacillus sp. LHD-117]|uniref:GntR family transcriptional regulator n=1 Tax=Paenibacillus sp. LHD-117 TaxID=3071412 RepID=UPI0027E12D60|nr:GntR family transcriptional regulator [Paenibacillus sp. LHD-117]MDQ6419120.1 GntR family transcriptional regulator [Paenibacillus sp. LHD-117]